MDENDAEIVATCEAAVTHLTEVGWHQGEYIGEGEVSDAEYDGHGEVRYTIDYTGATVCLGGAIALATTAKVFVDSDIDWSVIARCPAIPAVAAVIREKHDVSLDHYSPATCSETYDEATVYAFNDAHFRKVDDVIDVLNETIKRHSSEVIEP